MFLNPGSIGPRRFSLPISFAMLRIDGEQMEAEFIELDA
jgi:predicted phosphodiesterase